MKRRDFIFAGGVMAAWPLVAGAQGPAMPVIGVLFGLSDNNPEHRSFFNAFIDEFTRLGWKARIEQRWTNADNKRANAFATELVALRPDVILTATTPATAACIGKPARSRPCLPLSAIRWAPVLSRICGAPAVT
jgi:putative tryptophan/tyrosine transport system substrate-binding protein